MLGRNIKKRKRKRVENKVVDGNKEKMTSLFSIRYHFLVRI